MLRCALAALPDHWKSVASQWLPGGLPPSLGAPQAGTHCSHQKAASAFMSAGERHAVTSENVKIAACKWFEKALKRSPSCTPRSTHSGRPTPHNSGGPSFEQASETPRGVKKTNNDNNNNSNSILSDSATTTSSNSTNHLNDTSTPRALEQGESPTLHWAAKTFKMTPKVERRIWNVALAQEQHSAHH